MLTLLINETKPLAGLFASTTGGIGSVPDISVADEGQAVSVQTFTRTAGVITDSFVAGDVLHIGIGDGVNAPVCYIALASASPATGTMAINTVGMVALFAATSANQLTLNVGVVRTRGGNTNTIFSAPIVIHRSVIDPDTAVPTPSILGTGVAAALLVAINTALGFVRLDASARLPAVDGSQLTNVPNELPSQTGNSGKYLTTNGTAASWGAVSTGLTVGTTAIASGASGRILYDNAGVLGELPVGTGVATALAINVGSAGAFLTSAVTSITGTANEITVTGTTTPTLSLPSALTFTGKTVTGGTFTGGAFNGTVGATTPSTIAGTTGTFSGAVSTTGNAASIFTGGASASIFTLGENGNILTMGASGYIETRSTYKLNSGSFITTLSHAPTANRAIAFPDADGTLALVSGDLGTPSAIVLTNATGTASININGTVGATTPSTVAGTTGTFNSTVTVGANSQAGTLNITNSSGATMSSISGADGSASFASGTVTIDLNGNFAADSVHGNSQVSSPLLYCASVITIGDNWGDAAWIDVDGSASFAYGALTIGSDGTTISNVGIKAANGLVSIGNTDGTAAWINSDGSASFASGTFTATTSLLLGTAGSAVGNIGFRNATSGTTTLAPATGALGTGTVTLPLSGTLATLQGSNTYTAANTFSLAPGASTSAISTTGALYAAGTGTTNFPHIYINESGATASSSWSTTGTALGINLNTTSPKFIDCKVDGTAGGGSPVSYFEVDGTGNVNAFGALYIRANSAKNLFQFAIGTSAANMMSGFAWQWAASSTEASGTKDLTFSRQAAGILQIGTSSANALGSLGCLNIVAGGTLSVTGASTLTGLLTANGGITLGDAQNIAFNTTTGTKIGAATTQKLSFWNATPIVQPTTAVASATVAHTGGGTNIKTDDTFDGYTIAQVVKALRNAGLLA
jgi:hypothetical protein